MKAICTNIHEYRKHITIVSEIRKHLTLCMVSIGCTLLFRVLSLLTGLETTFYPLNYTTNVLCIFLLLKFNLELYHACCLRNERNCFRCCICCSTVFCRFKYETNSKNMQITFTDVEQEVIEFTEQQELKLFEERESVFKKQDETGADVGAVAVMSSVTNSDKYNKNQLLLANLNTRINQHRTFLVQKRRESKSAHDFGQVNAIYSAMKKEDFKK